jgi:hypothetical protein
MLVYMQPYCIIFFVTYLQPLRTCWRLNQLA